MSRRRRKAMQQKKSYEFNPAMAAQVLEERRAREPIMQGVCQGCGRAYNYFYGFQKWWAEFVQDGKLLPATEIFLEVRNAELCTRCNPEGHARLLDHVECPAKKKKSLREMQAQEEKQISQEVCELPPSPLL